MTVRWTEIKKKSINRSYKCARFEPRDKHMLFWMNLDISSPFHFKTMIKGEKNTEDWCAFSMLHGHPSINCIIHFLVVIDNS